MDKRPPTVENVLALLPQIQNAIRREIDARIAAGEPVAYVEEDLIMVGDEVQGSLRERRQTLLDEHARRGLAQNQVARKSA